MCFKGVILFSNLEIAEVVDVVIASMDCGDTGDVHGFGKPYDETWAFLQDIASYDSCFVTRLRPSHM